VHDIHVIACSSSDLISTSIDGWLVCLQVLCTSYELSVKMMSDSQFLSHLMNFPKEQINDETVELLQPYFNAPDFNFESAAKASGNVAGLCNWAEAMCQYHTVAVVVEPKIAALREAEAELKIANKCAVACHLCVRRAALLGCSPARLWHVAWVCAIHVQLTCWLLVLFDA
jgi:hypothetical protein